MWEVLVHYLKCEERGYQEMCDVSERVYKVSVKAVQEWLPGSMAPVK